MFPAQIILSNDHCTTKCEACPAVLAAWANLTVRGLGECDVFVWHGLPLISPDVGRVFEVEPSTWSP